MADPTVNSLTSLFYRTKQWFFEAIAEEPPGSLYSSGVDLPTIEKQKDIANYSCLQDLLPYEVFDEESGLYFNDDSIGFVLKALPAVGLDITKLRVVNGIFSMDHRPGTVIQVSNYRDSNISPILEYWRKHKATNANDPNYEMFNKLAQARVDYIKTGQRHSLFSDQPYLLSDFNLMIAYTVPVSPGIAPVDVPKSQIDDLLRMKAEIISTLQSANISSALMPPDQFKAIIFGLLNPSVENHPKMYYEDNELLKYQCADSNTALLVGRDGCSLIRDELTVSVLPWSVNQFSKTWRGDGNGELIGASMNNILRLPCPFIQTLIAVVPDQTSEKGRTKAKVMRATQMKDSPIGKFATQWNERHADWKFMEQQIGKGNKSLRICYQIVLFPEQGREREAERTLNALFNSHGWILQKDRFIPVHAFLSALPMWIGRESLQELYAFKRFRQVSSWNATNLAPLIGEWKGTETPLLLLLGRRGQLMFLDNFDNKQGNYNISIAAAPGAGKSVLAQDFVINILSSGGRGFIIDSGRSHENTCAQANGTYLDFGKLKPCLNPFTNLRDLEEGLPLLKLLVPEMASPKLPLDSVQTSYIEQAVQMAWQKKENKATITTIVECLLEIPDDKGRTKDLATMLYPYTARGSYGRYFEGECNIDFNNNLVVLELDDLNNKPDLQAVVLLILMFNITQVCYLTDRSQRKFCMIDEAWRLLAQGNAGKFIEEGYRVIRKYNGCFITITQRIGDYFNSPVSQAAYACSDWIWILRQKKESLDECETNKWLDMSGGRKYLYQSLETRAGMYSELAVISPNGVAVGRLVLDPFSEKLYSTKGTEVAFIRQKQAEGMTLEEAVQAMVNAAGKR